MAYTIRRTETPPSLTGVWDSDIWQQAETLRISHFRPESSDHRPRTEARLLYDSEAVYLIFRVEDRYVRSVQTEYMGPVCTDSCVEFFVAPKAAKGYINFEVNAGGTLLASYIEDATRTAGGFAMFANLPPEHGQMVRIYHLLPDVVDPEITEPVTWTVEYAVPLALLEAYVGPIGDPAGQTWRANLYKCGDKTSHPHWAAWSPVSELNFHLPQSFGLLCFG